MRIGLASIAEVGVASGEVDTMKGPGDREPTNQDLKDSRKRVAREGRSDSAKPDREQSSTQTAWLIVGIALIGLPLLYLLSFGPMVGLFAWMRWDFEILRTVYEPVNWLHDHTFLEKPLEVYLDFFVEPMAP